LAQAALSFMEQAHLPTVESRRLLGAALMQSGRPAEAMSTLADCLTKLQHSTIALESFLCNSLYATAAIMTRQLDLAAVHLERAIEHLERSRATTPGIET